MPQPDNCTRLTMQFDLLNGSDQVEDHAQFAIWSDPNPEGPPNSAWLQNVADKARDEWIALISKTHYSSAVQLNRVLCGLYDTTGKLRNEKASAATAGDWRGTASQSLPWSITPVVSLYTYQRGTFVLQGRSKRGRIYLPPVGTNAMGNAVTGEMSVATAEGFRDDVGLWLSALVGYTPEPGTSSFHPSVLSVTHNYINEVSYLSVDTKLDTQRRREKQQQAVVSTVAWP